MKDDTHIKVRNESRAFVFNDIILLSALEDQKRDAKNRSQIVECLKL